MQFTPIILAIQEAEIRKMVVQGQLGKEFSRPYLKKTHHKKGLVEWLKCRPSVQTPIPQKRKRISTR
jgi:hypothetical protein